MQETCHDLLRDHLSIRQLTWHVTMPASDRGTMTVYNNPRWGAPRIHGELLKLGIEITEPTVAKYMVRHHKPPSQTWRTFLENHVQTMVSVDFFTVPTIRFEILSVFLVLAHERRRIVHFAVTAHPTAEWTVQ